MMRNLLRGEVHCCEQSHYLRLQVPLLLLLTAKLSERATSESRLGPPHAPATGPGTRLWTGSRAAVWMLDSPWRRCWQSSGWRVGWVPYSWRWRAPWRGGATRGRAAWRRTRRRRCWTSPRCAGRCGLWRPPAPSCRPQVSRHVVGLLGRLGAGMVRQRSRPVSGHGGGRRWPCRGGCGCVPLQVARTLVLGRLMLCRCCRCKGPAAYEGKLESLYFHYASVRL